MIVDDGAASPAPVDVAPDFLKLVHINSFTRASRHDSESGRLL